MHFASAVPHSPRHALKRGTTFALRLHRVFTILRLGKQPRLHFVKTPLISRWLAVLGAVGLVLASRKVVPRFSAPRRPAKTARVFGIRPRHALKRMTAFAFRLHRAFTILRDGRRPSFSMP